MGRPRLGQARLQDGRLPRRDRDRRGQQRRTSAHAGDDAKANPRAHSGDDTKANPRAHSESDPGPDGAPHIGTHGPASWQSERDAEACHDADADGVRRTQPVTLLVDNAGTLCRGWDPDAAAVTISLAEWRRRNGFGLILRQRL